MSEIQVFEGDEVDHYPKVEKPFFPPRGEVLIDGTEYGRSASFTIDKTDWSTIGVHTDFSDADDSPLAMRLRNSRDMALRTGSRPSEYKFNKLQFLCDGKRWQALGCFVTELRIDQYIDGNIRHSFTIKADKVIIDHD